MIGELLTIWTIRVALLCYAACLGGWLILNSSRWANISRLLWTVGCVLFVAHVACAFHFYHGWSHQAAWETTALQTKELIGWSYGDGIYFSYVFLLIWVIDVGWSWTGKTHGATTAETSPTPGGGWKFRTLWLVLVHSYLLFIAFNGAVIFEDGPIRWAGIAVCVLLGLLAIRYLVLGGRTTKTRQLQTDNAKLKPVHEAP